LQQYFTNHQGNPKLEEPIEKRIFLNLPLFTNTPAFEALNDDQKTAFYKATHQTYQAEPQYSALLTQMQDYAKFKEWFTSIKNPTLPKDVKEKDFEIYVNKAITSEEGYKTYIEALFNETFTADRRRKKLNSELIDFVGKMHNDVYDTSNLNEVETRRTSANFRNRIIKDTRNGIYDILHGNRSNTKDRNYLKYLVTSEDATETTHGTFELKDDKGANKTIAYDMNIVIPTSKKIEVNVTKNGETLSFKGGEPIEVIKNILEGVSSMIEIEPKKERLHYVYTFLKSLFK
jgi:hypothetical protein